MLLFPSRPTLVALPPLNRTADCRAPDSDRTSRIHSKLVATILGDFQQVQVNARILQESIQFHRENAGNKKFFSHSKQAVKED
jgi:hypothetical protein